MALESERFMSSESEHRGGRGAPTDQPLSSRAALTGIGLVVANRALNRGINASCMASAEAPDELFVPIKQINDVPDRETLLLMTGSQGEPLAALSRISRGEHPQVKVKTTDTIIFSASPIPGNTISVVNTIDKLMMLGAKVVYGCLLYTSPSPRDKRQSRMPSSA